MPNRNTYYSEQELEALEAIAANNDESFSGVVREAVQDYWGIDE